MSTYYQILGVSMRASEAEIKAAYKRLAMQYHPDRNNGSKFHEEYFKKVLEAYQTLSDRHKRDRYDLTLLYSSLESYGAPRPAPTRQGPPRPEAGNPGRPYNTGSNRKPGERRQYAKRTREYAMGKLKMPKLTLQNTSAGVLFLACMLMFGFWIDNLVHRNMAEKMLKFGEFNLALVEDSTYSPAYLARSRFKKNIRHDIFGALEDIELGIKYLDKPNPVYNYERGLLLMELQRYKPALKDFETVAKLNPKQDTALILAASIRLYQLNDFTNSILLFKKVLALKPKHYEATFGLGYAYLQQENYSEAKRNFTSAKNIDPTHGNLFYYSGFANFALKDTLAACFDWDAALNNGYEDAKEPYEKNCGVKTRFHRN